MHSATMTKAGRAMLTDRSGLFLSTTSPGSRDACIEGRETEPTMRPGAIETFDRAIAAFNNGLIGSSGRAGQKRTLLNLLDRRDEARRMPSGRHRGSSHLLVAGLPAGR